MMHKTIFLSAPLRTSGTTTLADNMERATRLAPLLEKKYYTYDIVLPHRLFPDLDSENAYENDHGMMECLRLIRDSVDVLVYVPAWGVSEGVRFEIDIADANGVDVFAVDEEGEVLD